MTAAPIAVRGDVDERAVEQLAALRGGRRRGRAACSAPTATSATRSPSAARSPTADHISPSGVGYDIACGNKAVRTDLLAADSRDDVAAAHGRDLRADQLRRRPQERRARRPSGPRPIRDADFAPQRALLDMAAQAARHRRRRQPLRRPFAGDDGYVWVGVHFGSRGFGHKTASGFLALAAGLRFEERGPRVRWTARRSSSRRLGARAVLHRGDGARGRVRLRRPRHRRRQGARDPRRRVDLRGPQPPQLLHRRGSAGAVDRRTEADGRRSVPTTRSTRTPNRDCVLLVSSTLGGPARGKCSALPDWAAPPPLFRRSSHPDRRGWRDALALCSIPSAGRHCCVR